MMNILIVEDLPTDAELARREIMKEVGECRFSRVDNKDDYLRSLRESQPDLIVSDYMMPAFDGMTALEIALEKMPDVPFIILTGSMNEETAVDCMKAGAWDYVIKEHVKRLGPAVRNALEQKHLRRSKKKAEKRITHLYQVLNAIRRINQLIVREKDLDELIRKACECFIENPEYFGAWIILFDENNQVARYAQSGLDSHFHRLLDTIQKGKPPLCMQKSSEGRDPIVFPNPEESCPRCPVKGTKSGKSCLAAPLIHDGKRLGVLTVSFSSRIDPFEEEKNMIREVSQDIAYALYNLETAVKRREAEENLAESEVRYRELFDSIRDAILVADTKRNIINCNKAFTTLFGYTLDEIRGKQTHSVYDDMDEFQQMGQEIKQNMDTPGFLYTIQYRKKSGAVFPGETGLFYLKDSENSLKGFIGLIRDISERLEHQKEKKQLEKKLQQAQKMESIGTLAGGIAHDFNNILSAILGYSQLALSDVSSGRDYHGDLKEIHKAGLRASDLVRQILTFSRKSEAQFMPMKAAPIIKEAVKLLKSTIPSYIEVKSSIDNPKLKIMHDPTRLHQIMMNLCINASHAMEENGGVLTIEVKEEVLSETSVKKFSNLQTGDHLKIGVNDTGTGIPADILDSIFDPYFTTKDPKEGTGLGLAVVHGLVKEGKGDIQVRSVPGEGTAFTIYFPAVEEKKTVEEVEEDRPLEGQETILFVDDEPSVAKLGARLLKKYGYEVKAETDSLKALDTIRQESSRFDLVITDMAMPRLTGDMLLEEVIKINPDLPVILATGWTKRMSPEQAIEKGFKAVIKKPFSQVQLAGAVRKILDT